MGNKKTGLAKQMLEGGIAQQQTISGLQGAMADRAQAMVDEARKSGASLGGIDAMRANLPGQLTAAQSRAGALARPSGSATMVNAGEALNKSGMLHAGEGFQGAQSAAMQRLQALGQRQGPSAAELQLRQGTDRAMQQALSMARSQPGLSPAAAARIASQQQAGMAMDANAQAAMLRAQEEAQARGQTAQEMSSLANIAGQGRQQDLARAQGIAGLQMQGDLANQNALNTRQLQLALANQQAEMQQRGLNDQQAQFLQTLGLDANKAQLAADEAQRLRTMQALGGQLDVLGGIQGQLSGFQNALLGTGADLRASKRGADAQSRAATMGLIGGLAGAAGSGLATAFGGG